MQNAITQATIEGGSKKRNKRSQRTAENIIKSAVRKGVTQGIAKEDHSIVRNTNLHSKAKTSNRNPLGRTPNANVAVIGRTIQRIIQSISAPGTGPTIRYNGSWATDSTAIASPVFRTDINAAITGITSGQQLDEAEMFAAVFRDPVRNSIVYDANKDARTFRYDAVFFEKDSNGYFGIPLANEWRGVHVGYWQQNSAYSSYGPHGPVLPVGKTKGTQYSLVFMNAEDQITIFFAASAQPVKARLSIYENGTVVEHFVAAQQGAGTVSLTLDASKPGYYLVEVVAPVTPFEMTVQGMSLYGLGNSCFNHRMVKDLENKLFSVKTARILGQSIMYTNSSPIIDKGGKCTMYQLNGGEDWLDFALKGYVYTSNANKAGKMTVEKGMYGFLKPSSPDDFNMRNFAGYNLNGQLETVWFDLDSTTQYIVFNSNILDEKGRDGYFTFCTSIEFKTEDQWHEQKVSDQNNLLFERSMSLIRDLEQYHENPFHMKDIMAGARNVVAKILQYGPKVMEIAKLLA